MNEKHLKRGLVAALRQALPGVVIFSHAERIISGVPDLSVTWAGHTTWLELKHRTIAGRGIQDLTLQRLARQGRAFYVLYTDADTQIVDPSVRVTVEKAPGRSHQMVVSHIRRTHGGDDIGAVRVRGVLRDEEGEAVAGGRGETAQAVHVEGRERPAGEEENRG